MHSTRDPSIIQVTRRAMATEFAVMLPASAPEMTERALDSLELLDEIEDRLSVFRPHSEISTLNREAHLRAVRVTAATFSLVERAQKMSEKTDGAFDVTAGPLVDLWGFTQRRGQKPTRQEIVETLAKVGYRLLVLNSNDRSIRFSRPGMSLNLGAIGKGEALDRIAEHLKANHCPDFLIHGGSSSMIAAGNQFGSEQTLDSSTLPQGWAIGISHPTKPQRRLAGIWLRDGALSTSGSGKQFFHHRGRRYGHVIDPRTGQPAGDLLSLTVLAESAADADALSTGWFVSSGANESVSDRTDVPMIAVRPDGTQDGVAISAIGDVPWVDTDDS